MKEKPECAKCLYAEYDYDGKEAIFLGCFRPTRAKCTGTITPATHDWYFEIEGKEWHVHQSEWLSYEGVAINLVVGPIEDGVFHRRLHAGYCERFLTEEEARKCCEKLAGGRLLQKPSEG